MPAVGTARGDGVESAQRRGLIVIPVASLG